MRSISCDQNFTSWLDARTLHVSQSQPWDVSLNGPSFSSRKSVRVSWHQSQRTTCGLPKCGLASRNAAATSFSPALRSSLRSTFPAVVRTICRVMKSSPWPSCRRRGHGRLDGAARGHHHVPARHDVIRDDELENLAEAAQAQDLAAVDGEAGGELRVVFDLADPLQVE